MATPRIMFLTRDLGIGGAQRQLIELAIGLHRLGWSVKVVTFYHSGRLESRLHDAGVEIYCLEKSGRWDVLAFMRRLVNLVRRDEPDIIHGYLDTPNVLLALLRPWLGQARVVWGIRASNMDSARYDRLAAVESRLAALCSRMADLIICNSEAGRAYHESRGYPASKMVVVPNGVDTQRFQPDDKARRAVRAEWAVHPQETLIGIVARLDAMKDHSSFLRAAAQTARAHPEARFVCVGEGPASYRDALMREAVALGLEGRLIWAGARDDIHQVYNALDLAVSSSSFGEGFPNMIGEAMATGIACVVTDVGDSAAIVGALGWVCAPNDSAALAACMCDALRAPRPDPVVLRERICAAFGSARLLERTVAELSRVAAPHVNFAARS
jgi:glycosyltransferase involved in cell wall biosynthesis